ncbi:hypothetical protein, partial [Desulfovibrio cuneatus]
FLAAKREYAPTRPCCQHLFFNFLKNFFDNLLESLPARHPFPCGEGELCLFSLPVSITFLKKF